VLRFDVVALRIMGSGFAAVTLKNNRQAEAAYKQEEQDAAPVFMAEYREPSFSVHSYLEWRLLQPGTAVRFAAQSDAVGQYALAEGYDAAAGGALGRLGFGLESRGALGFVNPERMMLLESGGAAAPLAKSSAKAGQLPVVTVSKQKAVSSQIAQVNAMHSSHTIYAAAPHTITRAFALLQWGRAREQLLQDDSVAGSSSRRAASTAAAAAAESSEDDSPALPPPPLVAAKKKEGSCWRERVASNR
jgi:hypothetical protein